MAGDRQDCQLRSYRNLQETTGNYRNYRNYREYGRSNPIGSGLLSAGAPVGGRRSGAVGALIGDWSLPNTIPGVIDS